MSDQRVRRGVLASAIAGAVAGLLLAAPTAANSPTTASPGLVAGAETQLPPEDATPATTADTVGHDLVAVYTTDGKRGYVWADELEIASGGAVASIEEAEEWMDHLADLQARGITEILIPAYLEDGVTVMGQFAVSIPHSNSVNEIPEEELREVFADDPEILEELLGSR